MKKHIYLFRIEVKGLKGCKMPENAISAFVNCIVPGETTEIAKKKLLLALKEDKYSLVNIDKIENFEHLNFDNNKSYLKMAKNSLKHDEVYYGEFNYYA